MGAITDSTMASPNLDAIAPENLGEITEYMTNAIESSNIKAVQDIIDKCVSNNASIYWSKDEVMTEIVSTLEGSKFKAEELVGLLPKINMNKNFAQSAALLGIHLYSLYEGAGDIVNATAQLSEALEHYKCQPGQGIFELDLHYKCAEFYAKQGNMMECAGMLSKARGLSAERKPSHEHKHKMLGCEVNQHQNKFLLAAKDYLKVLKTGDQTALRLGIVCSILALGQENNYRNAEGDWVNDRQPLLDAFADGAGAVDLDVQPYLERARRQQLFRKADIEGLAAMLEPHQATYFCGTAVHEHNLIVISKLYDNISFEQLARIMDVSPEQAEKSASGIISEGRLQASLSQLDGYLSFDQVAELSDFDENIKETLNAVQSIVKKIKAC